MEYRIVEDKTDGLILEIAEPYALLATFFAADIQQDPELCQYYLARINKVLSDDSYHTDLTGNAHTVTVTKTITTVASLFDETLKPVAIETNFLKEILEKWSGMLLKQNG